MRSSRLTTILYCFVLLIGFILTAPNLINKEFMHKYLPFLPDTRVTLGLDLKGGSYLVLEVDKAALLKEIIEQEIVQINNLFVEQNIPTDIVKKQQDVITIAASDSAKATKINELLQNPDNKIDTEKFITTKDDNIIKLTVNDKYLSSRLSSAIEQSIEIIRKRIDEVGVAEPSIQKIGTDRIMVQLPGMENPGELRNLLGKTAKLTFHFVDSQADKNDPPIGVSILPGLKQEQQTYAIKDQIALDGSTLIDAQAFNDMNVPGGAIKILFRLNKQGADIFRDITEQHIGEAFAIVLDGKVLTAPIIQSVIPNGTGEISGSFTMKEATQISALLRAGALPAPLKVDQEHTVGPDLGKNAIKMGVYTGILGFILVAIFVFLLYGVWGLIADLALALHTILTFAALSLLGATLTLPGIAGIILGIGIAVDANILINERIKEEARRGLAANLALERGFKQAFSTIVDANITAIIATILLYYYGSGPVRGFAITMGLGIMISMFTEVTLVRAIMNWFIKIKNIQHIQITPYLNFMPQHTNFKFMNARYIGILTSLILSIGSIVLMFKPGLNYGIDFRGGTQLLVQMEKQPDLDLLRSNLQKLSIGEVVLQKIAQENTVMVNLENRSNDVNQTVNTDKARIEITKLYPKAKFISSQTVGPKISGELTRNGFIALILATIAMSLYIWWRFEWFFAAGAILTLILDITKILGFFCLLRIDFNLTAIAAILTIIGYSINDKVVVYDRMRENMKLHRSMDLRGLIDMSINQVFIRCVLNSCATILAMLPMAIWGGIAVHNFSIPIIIGVVIVTSSSIFIAAPILLFLGNWWQNYQKKQKNNI